MSLKTFSDPHDLEFTASSPDSTQKFAEFTTSYLGFGRQTGAILNDIVKKRPRHADDAVCNGLPRQTDGQRPPFRAGLKDLRRAGRPYQDRPCKPARTEARRRPARLV